MYHTASNVPADPSVSNVPWFWPFGLLTIYQNTRELCRSARRPLPSWNSARLPGDFGRRPDDTALGQRENSRFSKAILEMPPKGFQVLMHIHTLNHQSWCLFPVPSHPLPFHLKSHRAIQEVFLLLPLLVVCIFKPLSSRMRDANRSLYSRGAELIKQPFTTEKTE